MAGVGDEQFFLGLDFGTESVRAIVVDRQGSARGSGVGRFRHGQITPNSTAAQTLFTVPLPAGFALQHPDDWIESAADAIGDATGSVEREHIRSIGVDFTSCTMLPCRLDGTPLALSGSGHERSPHAWPKLWKHHGAVAQTERMNGTARRRHEPLLARYGGIIGLEWFFPKMLEVEQSDPSVADATELWIEAGDWFVWQLVGGDVESLPRSTCQAGYKACWSGDDGYPSREFLNDCHPSFGNVLEKLPGLHRAPGECAGELCEALATRLRLRPGIPVSAAIIDAHAGVPGAGVAEPGVLVLVLGTSGCHMLMSEHERMIPGVAGIVRDGILPGYVGYETGQAAMGDAFDWARRVFGHESFDTLDAAARGVPAGSNGVLCVDWFNGCRTPLMDGSLCGAFVGLQLNHDPEHLYRAVLEASAMSTRWIVQTLRDGGVPVERLVATGGLPHHNPLFIEILASAIGSPIEVHAAEHGPALGAAIIGACAAGAFDSVHDAVDAMAGGSSSLPAPKTVRPVEHERAAYDRLFDRYLLLADRVRTLDGEMPQE